MALFASEKKVLLGKIKKRAWNTPDQQKEIFTKLADQDVKIGEILWMLSDPDRMVRQHVASIIIHQKMSGAAAAVLKEMREVSGATRAYLLTIIPKLNDPEVFDRVDHLMKGRDPKDRDMAIEVLLAHPTSQVEKYLIELLEHDNREYRYRALQKLIGERAEGTAMPATTLKYVRKMTLDKDERIRVRCVQMLAEQPDVATVELFLERVLHEQYNVKTAIIKAFESFMEKPELGMVDRLLPLLSQDDDMLRSTALTLTVKHSDPVEIIKKILIMSNQLMGWMRERILRTMQEFGDDLIPPIAELLGHEDPDVRKKALIFATDLTSPKLVKPVIKLIGKHEDWWTRIIAMDMLGRLADERAVKPLIACLDDDDVRWSAVESLSRIGSPKALGPIARLLGDKTSEVRLQVIGALELYNDPRALPLLKKSMEKDPEVDVRERALAVYRSIAEKNNENVDEKTLRQSFGYGKSERKIDKLLTETRRVGASDLHVMPGSPPTIRMNGKLKKIGDKPFTAKQTERLVHEMLSEKQAVIFKAEHQLDFCYTVAGVGRYRTNVYVEKNGFGAVFRVIPNELPTFLEVGLPEHISDIINYHQGLIIITGPAGSGKSTTLAALINLINERKRDHILTLEDPIEFVHPYKNSLVNQREIGTHSDTFASALRAALREDPDVIVVGELRDQETMTLAMTAAETGHIVIATMNTTSATKTVDRLVDAFPPKEQSAIRMMLSESLQVVTSQTLVPRADGKGRVAVHEVLMVTGPVRNLIRDDKTQHIPSAMTIGKEMGMQTVDSALQSLLERNIITAETAYRRADKKDFFEALVSKEFLEGQGGLS
ncbi:MAG: twitching motility protein PilT [Myxococcota bacterium]